MEQKTGKIKVLMELEFGISGRASRSSSVRTKQTTSGLNLASHAKVLFLYGTHINGSVCFGPAKNFRPGTATLAGLRRRQKLYRWTH